MKIGVVGSGDLATAMLRAAKADYHEVAWAVCDTRPDTRLVPAGCWLQDIDALLDCPPSVVDVVVLTDSAIQLPPDLYQHYSGWTRFGAIAYHPSLLPRHQGNDALQWALHLGDKIVGGTVYEWAPVQSEAPIIAQQHAFVLPGDTAEKLWLRDLLPQALRLLRIALNELHTRSRVIHYSAAATRVGELARPADGLRWKCASCGVDRTRQKMGNCLCGERMVEGVPA